MRNKLHFTVICLVFFVSCCSSFFVGQKTREVRYNPKVNCPEFPKPVPIANPTRHSAIAKALARLDAFLSNQTSNNPQIPGFMAVVVYDQSIVWGKGYGYKNPFRKQDGPPTLDSIVRLASITKVFTDLMAIQLRDKGKVNLDDPVTKYIPNFSIKNPFNTSRPITLRELGSHTSGMPREVPCDWERMNECGEQQILSRVANQLLLYPQYTHPHYSNLGLALLGRALQRVTGMEYEEYVQKQMLWPLGMRSSGFNYTQDVLERMAVGLTQVNGTVARAPILLLGWGNPMGGMYSTPRDMAKFMSFLFSGGRGPEGEHVLDSSSVAEVLTPIIVTPDGIDGFGFPWEFLYDPVASRPTGYGHWIKSKAGELPGYRSNLAIIQELKLGVFFSATFDDVPADVAHSVFTVEALEILIPAFTEVLWALQPKAPLPPKWSAYVGTYLFRDKWTYAEVTVRREGDGLVGEVFGTSVHYTYEEGAGGDILRIHIVRDGFSIQCRWLDDGIEDEFVYFHLDQSGKEATSLFTMGMTLQRISSADAPLLA
jgi:CubicO group peptidase (beta-lactamase class C family)